MERKKADTDRHLRLSEEEMMQSLTCFYRSAAEKAGYMETENTMYDCRKILAAPNVRDAIIKYYETAFPGISKEQICTLLLLAGPKTDAGLNVDEVVVQPGFVSENSI